MKQKKPVVEITNRTLEILNKVMDNGQRPQVYVFPIHSRIMGAVTSTPPLPVNPKKSWKWPSIWLVDLTV